MNVKDFMKTVVISIHQDATLRDAAQLVADHLVGLLPVVDDERVLVGVLSMDDILRQFIPPFVEMIEQADFIHDYGALESGKEHVALDALVRDLMQHRFYVRETDHLMAPIVIMYKHRSGDVPVVDEHDKLVGLVSHAQVGGMFLKDWLDRHG
ncbi:MAG: CBS domain-containing protein [Chloroflexi bacterium]|nr:CBS domain-containing protein [Chloroflexota bacterium]